MVAAASGLFILLSLASFHPADLSLFSSEPNVPLRNIGGVIGAWVGALSRGGFGWASITLPLLCGFWAVRLWRGEHGGAGWPARTIAVACLLTSLGTLWALAFGGQHPERQVAAGGVVGYLLVQAGQYYLGATGTALLAACVAGLAWVLVSDQAGLPSQWWSWIKRIPEAVGRLRTLRVHAPAGTAGAAVAVLGGPRISVASPEPDAAPVSALPSGVRVRSTAVVPKLKNLPSAAPKPRPVQNGFQLPSLDLLTTPPPVSERQLTDDLQMNAKILEDTLGDFGIEARCANIDRGPAVTRYEFAPAPGVKITRIAALADDLALVLKAANCHVIAPIPGKGLVGVDVPNSTSTTVYLKELLTAREFQAVGSPLTLPIGKDVSGQVVVCDLRDCPHLLVAGATGSGKTVFLNSLLTSLLYQASPEQVKFLMIDPKMVELVAFNHIPHLVAPVVTEAKRAAAALAWAVAEMERRYQLLAKAGVRNIAAYNQRCETLKTNGDGAGSVTWEPMPYLVIVIDELADLMLVASKDIEEAITRLAQLSRAVGLHVILATQRPSVDVITGVIKANFSARIAFQVASKVDSRTILDVNGADKLLGRGDLLFLRPGTAKPIRAQAALVTDAEIERVANHVKAQRQPAFDEQLIAKQAKPAEAFMLEKDELYETAKKLVLGTRQASTSLLQRRLRLGYGRAARILDLMEQEGVIGPPQGSRPREILVEPRDTGDAVA